MINYSTFPNNQSNIYFMNNLEWLVFAENLKHLRENDNLKQADMLAECGFQRSTWNGYETGHSFPSFKDLVKISEYFGILESDLIHTEVAYSDLNELYNKYINSKNPPLENADSTPSKSFKSYFQEHFSTLVGGPKSDFVTENVTKHVTFDPKKHKKGVSYIPQKEGENISIAAEPPARYSAGRKLTETERIAQLERTLNEIKHFFSRLEV